MISYQDLQLKESDNKGLIVISGTDWGAEHKIKKFDNQTFFDHAQFEDSSISNMLIDLKFQFVFFIVPLALLLQKIG